VSGVLGDSKIKWVDYEDQPVEEDIGSYLLRFAKSLIYEEGILVLANLQIERHLRHIRAIVTLSHLLFQLIVQNFPQLTRQKIEEINI